MSIHQQLYAAGSRPAVAAPGILRRALRELAVHDWLVLGYLAFLNVVTLRATPGADRTASLDWVVSLLALLIGSLLLIRGGVLKHAVVAPLVYRCAVYGTVQASYFLFARLLPIANTAVLDRELHRIDLVMFGFEPAVLMDRWVTSATTEWFAFFYFGYFFLLGVHVVPMLLLCRRARLLADFCFGMLIVFCVGHTLYVLVPGYGPYKAIPEQFATEFPSGAWLDMVMKAVGSAGAQKDIFPSLHTAAPLFFALFSFRNRAESPFRWTWMPVAFFAANIIVATMFLRWHWLIDVVAGIALAIAADSISARVGAWEARRRHALGLGPVWPQWLADADEARR
jgi:membrane-associated phospholipid phosphatase